MDAGAVLASPLLVIVPHAVSCPTALRARPQSIELGNAELVELVFNHHIQPLLTYESGNFV